ncbi:sterol-4-alpha-carboxylate 3-dehydrogenase [Trametopsis cervina]|nr:sterol-4-alpha-carboxylate 3-dehydrogenase [Trametopsis cervina]
MAILVIGGVGFLGSHIVHQLAARGTEGVAVLDLTEPSEDDRITGVQYLTGDIRNEERIVEVLKEVKPSVVLHTASPVHGLASKVYYEVNETGTRNVVSACVKTGTKKLVYTSSTGVVWTGAPFNGVTEDQVEIPQQGYDAYHHTKALGERIVLEAQKKDGLEVVVLRPCGMTGERDRQLIWRLAEVLEKKQNNVQIGDNTNLVDYCYVGNAAEAHILAADRLLSEPENVSGQVFFITNGEPMPIWNFSRKIWKELGDDGKAKVMKIPRVMGLVLAVIAETWSAITRSSTQFTRFSVHFLTATQYYNIDKAKRLLGYEPKVSLDEGIKRTVQWWKETGAREHAERAASKKD